MNALGSNKSSGQNDGSQAATVVELLPQGLVRVELANNRQLLAHPAGGQEVNYVRLRPGDKVEVTISQQDNTRGRITRVTRT